LKTTNYILLEFQRTLVYKRLKIGPQFLLSPSINSAFCITVRLRTRRWLTELNQTVRLYGVNRAFWSHPFQKMGTKTFTVFLTTLKLNGKYLRNETRYRQPGTGVENYKGFSSFPKVHELWSTNAEKIGPAYYPLSVNSALCFIARLRTDTDLAHPISH